MTNSPSCPKCAIPPAILRKKTSPMTSPPKQTPASRAKIDAANAMVGAFDDIEKLGRALAQPHDEDRALAACNAVAANLRSLLDSLPKPPKTRNTSRLNANDLVARELIRKARGPDDLVKRTPSDLIIETIAGLSESGQVRILVGNGTYSASNFRRLSKQCGGVPFGTHLKMLKNLDPEWEQKAKGSTPAGMLKKEATSDFTGGARILDSDNGILGAIVSVTGIVDSVGDNIVPGAYAQTLKERWPKIVWSHSWDDPVARVLQCEEWFPGDSRLPDAIKALGGGALFMLMQFNLGTQSGKDAFETCTFFGPEQQWSIGFAVPSGGSKFDPKTGIRTISQIELYEASPVLFGAANYTMNLSSFTAPSSSLPQATRAMMNEQSMWGFIQAHSQLPNDATSRKKATALLTKIREVQMRAKTTGESMMEFALSGTARRSAVGQLKAMALVKAALKQQGQYDPDATADPSDPIYSNDGPGLVVAPHAYAVPAINVPIKKDTPCLICGQGPVAPIHTNRTSWQTALTSGGGQVQQPPRYA